MGRRAGDDRDRFEIGRGDAGWCVRDRLSGDVAVTATSSPNGLFRIEAEIFRDQLNRMLRRRLRAAGCMKGRP
jgi:hypothetical protein